MGLAAGQPRRHLDDDEPAAVRPISNRPGHGEFVPEVGIRDAPVKEVTVAKDHGPSVKDDEQYEGLRKKGMSKSRAAAIANSPGASSRGGKSSGSSQSRRSSGAGSGGNTSQKKAAGRKGGKASS
jgi:hypothetical protein